VKIAVRPGCRRKVEQFRVLSVVTLSTAEALTYFLQYLVQGLTPLRTAIKLVLSALLSQRGRREGLMLPLSMLDLSEDHHSVLCG
jgi:hypothetical protein